ncbi:MAG TPA: SPFH domain-containing protein, partial [Saccharofermentans sp.]|nr:SPFH domain-containing protein [Saccharofermentans sp.]
MGLISNIVGVIGTSVSSSVRDQYLEFFTSDSLGQDVLVRRGATSIKNGKNKGNSDIISNGSKIAVPEGTALLLVDNGKVVDFTTEAGMYTWDSSSAPSVLSNLDFLDNAKNVVKDTWNRMRMGGELAQQQRIYYVNMLQILNNAFGTPTPLPYHDPEYRNIYIRMNGYFSFRIADPVAFFKSLTGNIGAEYTKLDLMGRPAEPLQPRAEFLDRFSEVLNKCGGVDKIMFANLPSEQKRLREYMQQALDEEWMQARGMLVEMVAINSITPDDKSRERIEQIDQAKNFSSDPNALAAQAILGQTEAMKLAGGNSAG